MVFQCWSLQRLNFLGVRGWVLVFLLSRRRKKLTERDQKLLPNHLAREAMVYRKLPTQYHKVCSNIYTFGRTS